MLYELPETPAITLVGPGDASWWTAVGQHPAGRSALVIGDPADPATALVITAPLPQLGVYLHRFHAALIGAVQTADERTATARDDQSRTPRRAPANLADTTQPAPDLITLAHTGIHVPDPALQVTTYRELPNPDGVAYTATVRWGRTPVGTIHNEGTGGPTTYWPAAGSAFGHRRLAEFVAASRTADGQPLTEEVLLDELITEYENVEHVTAAARAGRSPVRLRAPLGAGDGLDELYYTAERRTAAKITTPGQRDALVDQLRRVAVVDGAWWQLWTGQAWEDLTTPTQPDADEQGSQ
jgi:hypothetical protein